MVELKQNADGTRQECDIVKIETKHRWDKQKRVKIKLRNERTGIKQN